MSLRQINTSEPPSLHVYRSLGQPRLSPAAKPEIDPEIGPLALSAASSPPASRDTSHCSFVLNGLSFPAVRHRARTVAPIPHVGLVQYLLYLKPVPPRTMVFGGRWPAADSRPSSPNRNTSHDCTAAPPLHRDTVHPQCVWPGPGKGKFPIVRLLLPAGLSLQCHVFAFLPCGRPRLLQPAVSGAAIMGAS